MQFYPGLHQCGDSWIELRDTTQPQPKHCCEIAARILKKLKSSDTVCEPLFEALSACYETLYWEQSYTKQDGVVSDAMLSGYAFTELAGSLGPAVSDQIRIGFGLWDAGIHYPEHAHHAEEVYCVLAGEATFVVGTRSQQASTGRAVYVPHNRPHSFSTHSQPLLILYLWQGLSLIHI